MDFESRVFRFSITKLLNYQIAKSRCIRCILPCDEQRHCLPPASRDVIPGAVPDGALVCCTLPGHATNSHRDAAPSAAPRCPPCGTGCACAGSGRRWISLELCLDHRGGRSGDAPSGNSLRCRGPHTVLSCCVLAVDFYHLWFCLQFYRRVC